MPAAATTLAFSTQPTVGQSIQATGTGTFSASVTVQDADGNTVTTATNAVTLAIGTNPSAGVLACTDAGGLTVNAVSGVATFTGCSITEAGTGYTLAAASSPVLTPPVNANAFTITAGDGQPARFHHPAGRRRAARRPTSPPRRRSRWRTPTATS